MRLVKISGVPTIILATLLGASAFGLDHEHLKPVARDYSTSGEKYTLNLQSDQGDFVGGGKTYQYTQADFDGVSVSISAVGSNPEPSQLILSSGVGKGFWELMVDSNKLGKPLTVRSYNPVATFFSEPANTAGFDFVLSGEDCGSLNGLFTITAIAFDCGVTGAMAGQPHLKQLVMTFEVHCGGGKPALRGQFSYTDATGVSCDSVGSGGSGGGNPTPTPQPTPAGPVIVLSDDLRETPVVMGNAVSTTALFSTFIPDTTAGPVTLSVTTDADNLLASVTPSVITATGTIDGVATITTTPTTLAGDHAVTITATTPDGSTSSATIFVTVICDPPFILGLDQPKSSTVSPGRPALLSVTASGSGPFTYQWFTGASGLVNFPLPGGTTANFTTSAINDTSQYWVRITNPCGSVNSQTVTVNVSAGAKPNTRR